MGELPGNELRFRRALYRISAGVLCRTDLCIIEGFVDHLMRESPGDGEYTLSVRDNALEVASSFNKFMYHRVVLTLVPKLERRIRSIVNKLKILLTIHKDEIQPITLLQSKGVGLFHLALVRHAECRVEQLSVLKTLLADSQFVLSPFFASLIANLLESITCEEFETYISSDILRLLKRGQKGVAFTLFTLQKYLKPHVTLSRAVDITENLKQFLMQQDGTTIFGAEKVPYEEVKRKGPYGQVVSELIHWFSGAAFRSSNCPLAKYLRGVLDSFSGTSRLSAPNQEINAQLLLLLLPIRLEESIDATLVSNVVESYRLTIRRIAKSHPLESVQLYFIQIVGHLLALLPDSDFENLLMDILSEQMKPLEKLNQKTKDVRINDAIVSATLYGLRYVTGAYQMHGGPRTFEGASKLKGYLTTLIQFSQDKPVYKNCLFEAMFVMLHLEPDDVTYLPESSTTAAARASEQMKLSNVLEAMHINNRDPLGHLSMCENALKRQDITPQDGKISTLMGMKNIPSMVEAVTETTGSQLYATMVDLYEELCNKKDDVKHPVLACVYTRQHVERRLQDFNGTLQEHHIYNMLLTILHSSIKLKYKKSIRMLRDAWMRYNSDKHLFTVLVHCILLRCPLAEFPNGSDLSRIINSRPCKVIRVLAPVSLDENAVFGIVHHSVEEGTVPLILDHYLAFQDADVSELIRSLLLAAENTLNKLRSFEKEDFEIYLAPADKLYQDSRQYQPNIHQSDKKKFSNLTKQQLDEMRYKDQCAVRREIAHLVKKVNTTLYALSRALAHKRDYLKAFLRDFLVICKMALGVSVLRGSFSLFMDMLCQQCLIGVLPNTAGRISFILQSIYSEQDYRINYDNLNVALNDLSDSCVTSTESGILITEITTYVLSSCDTNISIKEACLRVILKFLGDRVDIGQRNIIDAVAANLRNEALYPSMIATLKEAVKYMVDHEGITSICKIGLSSTTSLVREVVAFYVRDRRPDSLGSIAKYLMIMGIDVAGLSCPVKHIIDLLPQYVECNPELLDLAPKVFLLYSVNDVMDSFQACYQEIDRMARGSLIVVLIRYFSILSENVVHSDIFDRFVLMSGDSSHVHRTLDCCKALSKTVPTQSVGLLIAHMRTWMDNKYPQALDALPSGFLAASDIVTLGVCATFMGYLQEKIKYDSQVKWNLELLLKILSFENEFSKAEAGYNSAAIIASLARICALEDEEDLLNTKIPMLLSSVSDNDFATVPCVSLLKGGGLLYLKKHNIVAKIKESLRVKGMPRELLFVKELANQFGRLFEPYVKDIFSTLLRCFPDSFDVCLDTCATVLGILTPVGFKSILPIITESLGTYSSNIKLGCLRLLSQVIKNSKLQSVIIKNVSDVVKVVSPCTTDTQKAVKDAAEHVLDSIVGLAGTESILYPTMGSILKVLSHPSDMNVLSTMQALYEYARNHPNDEGKSHATIGVVELGLLEPVLSRSLKSRNGSCRQSAIVFSSWLVYRCGGYREVELFFTTFMPNLTDHLKDTLPEIRREAARAIGCCANAFKRFGCDTSKVLMIDLINRLMKCLMESITSLERCSAAAGLAEALWAVDDVFVEGIVTKVLKILDSRDSTPQMREGCLALFRHLPLTCHDYMLTNLDTILSRVMGILCDEDERVRDMASNVIRTVIEKYHESSRDIVFNNLRLASRSKEWQTRNIALPLLQFLNTLKEDNRVTVELYIGRYDQNPTVKTTAMDIWKGMNVTRSLRTIFPLVLHSVIELLEQDDDEEDTRVQAGECITDAISRLGSDTVNDFIEAILNCDGAFRGRCIGIASLASNGKAGIEKHLPRILQFLKECLCKTCSCHEASKALATLAGYFPAVVSEVLPSLVSDLFSKDEKDAYLVGITLLIESHSECYSVILQEVLNPELDVTRLALLERMLCAKRTKVVFSQQNILSRCLSQMLLYYRAFPKETMASFSAFVSLVRAESVMRLIHILIEMLDDLAAGSNDGSKKSTLIVFVSRVLELRDCDVDSHYGNVADSLSRYIFADPGTMEASILVLDQLIKSAERRAELDNLIGAFSKYFSAFGVANGQVQQTSLTTTLPLMMSLIQKGLVKSNAKIEAAKCVTALHKLVGTEHMGPFILKTIGAIIRCLNDKCPSLLKISLLEAIHSLLHCEVTHVRVILYQLQSALFKCLSDVNSEVNMLIGPTLRLYVRLAPNKSDSVLADLLQLASDKVGKPTVKTASLHAITEVLSAPPNLTTPPFEELLRLLQDCSGTDKQLVCQAIGLSAQLEGDYGSDWLPNTSALSALSSIVLSDRGFTRLYQTTPKDFVDVLRQSLKSDMPSVNLCALNIFCRISKLTRSSPLARDFVKSYLSILPPGAKLPPSGQSQILQIYKRLLRFEQNVPNFGSQLAYISEAIYGVPLVKLEAEKVLLVLLGPSHDMDNMLSFMKQHSPSDKVTKLLSEYALRVLVKGNKNDQLSDSDA
ncbi:HEAT repeat family protein, putative [Babesia bigemina]|uniref:HEAT repeat family protein, putative n=1 Tax=Babesia bigemina TaxID=5866 RepID=A0A061D3H3_BABBI|nr:HEAT repeat family protein, putative [Babesia bigemina]CDR95271.1 HEAT repeat family protein, putative [Babesia bigemina]|eukprot:XP_012767457.1 HEAT repeat family protein, putative [Babesia bigemina]